MSERRPDVAVVGAGPVGLTLALRLARSGRSVLVLEREPSTTERSRAPAIWPRTQEVLAELGVVDRFLERGTVLGDVELWDADRGRTLLRLPVRELAEETEFPHLLVLPQSETERLLHRELAGEPAADVRFSSEVVEVGPSDREGVRLVYRRAGDLQAARARFVAGCDGAHSTVRDRIGADFPGITYSTRAALADVRLDGEGGWRFPRVTARNRVAVGIRFAGSDGAGDGEVWRLILPFAPDDELPLDERVDLAVRDLFAAEGHRTLWKSEFRLHRRVASRFAAGRVVLAGDAAHLNSPVGGQGMNSGMQDAYALGPALAGALDRDDPGPLERYAVERRRAVVEGVNRFTDRLTRVLLGGRGRLFKPVLRLVSVPLRVPPLRRRFLRRLAMLDDSG